MDNKPKKFQSIFKINNVPIMPPVIDQKLRQEILLIRELVRANELKFQNLKEKKDSQNLAKQLEKEETDNSLTLGPRRKLHGSYTLSEGFFDANVLPKIAVDSSESDKNTVVDGPASLDSIVSDFDDNANDKSSKDLKNEIDKMSITPLESVYQEAIEPQVNSKLKDLIERQKQEYLDAMDELKHKFTSEQHELLSNFQSNFVTSTPLDSSVVRSEISDDDFTAFKTALQSQSLVTEEKTLVNDDDAKIKAAIVLQSGVRGYLVRRLFRTVYVQDHIRFIKETLHLVLGLDDHAVGGSPVQNILLKAKLFRQLQTDLYNFNAIFTNTTTVEKMKIISTDREVKLKKQVEENQDNLSLSFRDVV